MLVANIPAISGYPCTNVTTCFGKPCRAMDPAVPRLPIQICSCGKSTLLRRNQRQSRTLGVPHACIGSSVLQTQSLVLILRRQWQTQQYSETQSIDSWRSSERCNSCRLRPASTVTMANPVAVANRASARSSVMDPSPPSAVIVFVVSATTNRLAQTRKLRKANRGKSLIRAFFSIAMVRGRDKIRK